MKIILTGIKVFIRTEEYPEGIVFSLSDRKNNKNGVEKIYMEDGFVFVENVESKAMYPMSSIQVMYLK